MADKWHTIEEYPQGEEYLIPCLVDFGDLPTYCRYGVRNFDVLTKNWLDEDGIELADYFSDAQRWAYIKDIENL